MYYYLNFHSSKYSMIVFSMIIVSDCCLVPTQQFFSHIMVRTSYIWWDDDDICFVLDQHVWWDFYSASSVDRHVATHYPDSKSIPDHIQLHSVYQKWHW